MLSFILTLFGFKKPPVVQAVPVTVPQGQGAETTASSPEEATVFPEQSGPILPPQAVDFLLSLLNTREPPTDLQSLPQSDRAFIASNIRRVTDNSLEIPMMPHAAVCIQQLLSDHNVKVADFIDVIKEDPTLSVELLRMANSSYLGFTYPTLDLQQAIVRVGFTQLHGLVTMLALRSRVLQSNRFKNEVEWIMELSLATAKLCQQLAGELGMKPDEAFTIGLLNHIEYFVVLGEASRYSSESVKNQVSQTAIIQTVLRLGGTIHDLIAASWGFTSVQGDNKDPDGEEQQAGSISLSERLNVLQRILVFALAGDKRITDTVGFDARKLNDAIDAAVAPTAR